MSQQTIMRRLVVGCAVAAVTVPAALALVPSQATPLPGQDACYRGSKGNASLSLGTSPGKSHKWVQTYAASFLTATTDALGNDTGTSPPTCTDAVYTFNLVVPATNVSWTVQSTSGHYLGSAVTTSGGSTIITVAIQGDGKTNNPGVTATLATRAPNALSKLQDFFEIVRQTPAGGIVTDRGPHPEFFAGTTAVPVPVPGLYDYTAGTPAEAPVAQTFGDSTATVYASSSGGSGGSAYFG